MGIGEENYLVRAFKFFDIANKGSLAKEGFQHAVEKVGVNIDPEVSFLV